MQIMMAACTLSTDIMSTSLDYAFSSMKIRFFVITFGRKFDWFTDTDEACISFH